MRRSEFLALASSAAAAHVQGGKLKVLAVMADSRAPGFEGVPTLKERGVDLSIGTWRGLGLRTGTPEEPVAGALAAIARKVAEEPSSREALARSGLGHAFAEAGALDADIAGTASFPRVGRQAQPHLTRGSTERAASSGARTRKGGRWS